ncbi:MULTISPECIES: S8 family serine peptidase [unclassified Nocardiopsis]|uniref:S8 family serine peptidase n=1 Tax=unclassified Nocardiopsis TaxID=2649073 RepID=UPI001359FC3E|nr:MULTISPECIES: S8 family serine peptidase [unclassified Nocardiopsis]
MLGGNSRSRTHTRRARGGAAAPWAAATATAVILGLTAAPAAADLIPDFRPEQWGLQAIAAQELWEDTQGEGVTVALPGASVNEEHPDLVGNVEVDTRFGDNDGDAGAGNAAAALVAAHGHGMDADGGVLGAAPEAALLVLPADDGLADAVREAAREGAQVILLPETDGGTDLTDATREAVSNGALVVGPAGGPEDPSVLTVAGTDQDGQLLPDSPDAGSIELTAPGADLVTADAELGQTEVTGAPYAAALAAGAAALLRADHPRLLPDQVREALVQGSQDGPDGLPALHLPSAQQAATAAAQNTSLADEDLLNRDDQEGVPVWAWFASVGAVLFLGVLLLVLWVRRSSADPYGVQAARREEDEKLAAERAAQAPPPTRRRKGGRRRKARGA